MKKTLLVLMFLSLLVASISLEAQISQPIVQSQSFSGTVTTPFIFPVMDQTGQAVGTHQLTWTVTGAISACTVAIQSATTFGGVYSAIVNGATQTCTTSGQFTITNSQANFVRINLLTFTATTGVLTVTYIGTPNSLASTNVGTQAFVTATYTNATTTFSNVPNLAFGVGASVNSHITCRITWQGSAGTTGPKYQFTGPAAPTAVAVGMNSVVTATTVIAASAVAFASPVANTGTVTAATNFTDTVDAGILNGTTAGTVQLQAAANGAGTLTIQQGSYCTAQ